MVHVRMVTAGNDELWTVEANNVSEARKATHARIALFGKRLGAATYFTRKIVSVREDK